MLEALCRQSSTTLDIVHAEDGPPITQRTLGLRFFTARQAHVLDFHFTEINSLAARMFPQHGWAFYLLQWRGLESNDRNRPQPPLNHPEAAQPLTNHR